MLWGKVQLINILELFSFFFLSHFLGITAAPRLSSHFTNRWMGQYPNHIAFIQSQAQTLTHSTPPTFFTSFSFATQTFDKTYNRDTTKCKPLQFPRFRCTSFLIQFFTVFCTNFQHEKKKKSLRCVQLNGSVQAYGIAISKYLFSGSELLW